MNYSSLERHYECLLPKERFRLALDAVSREDEVEFQRLVRTCPRKNYSARDNAFTNYLDACVWIGIAMYMLWSEVHCKFLAFLLTLTNPAVDKELADFGVRFDFKEIASYAKGINQGFTKFCEHKGIEPEKMLKFSKPILESFELNRKLFTSLDVTDDENKATEVYEVLCSLWLKTTGSYE